MISIPKCDESKPVLTTNQESTSILSKRNVVEKERHNSRQKCLQHELVLDAMANLTGSVKLQGIVKTNENVQNECTVLKKCHVDMVEHSTTRKSHGDDCGPIEEEEEEDLPPPLL